MKKNLCLLAAAGTALGLAQVAAAQPFVINLSGATLLQNTLNAPAGTNDFIDADGDGVSGQLTPLMIDQLAPTGLPPAAGTAPNNQHWIIQYRRTGSVNGYQELLDWGGRGSGGAYATMMDGVEIDSADASDGAIVNRTTYINAGAITGPANIGNPGAAPVRSSMNGLYTAQYTVAPNPTPGGIQINVAALDVPAPWGTRIAGGSAAFSRKPLQAGYGTNPRTTRNLDGSANGFDHLLADIGNLNLFSTAATPDANTVFTTSLAFAPVTFFTNLGTGLRQATQSELQYLFMTGRAASGENLVVVTRDSGSGTRNAAMSSIGVDSSWGVGENVGSFSNSSSLDLAGPNFIPGNKGGSSRADGTVRNTRLGVSYSGSERAVNSSLVTGGRLEMLDVRNDLFGGVGYFRANLDALLNNDTAESYRIGGPGSLVTIGDPRSAPTNKGGDVDNTNPDMDNVEAAAFVNNITRSVEAFSSVPSNVANIGMPGEFIATLLIPVNAQEFRQDVNDPTNWIANPSFLPGLQNYLLTQLNPPSVLTNPVFNNGNFGSITLNGDNPVRTASVAYSDTWDPAAGTLAAVRHISQGDANLGNAGSDTLSRNRIAGDGNGDGLRNWNDIAEMLRAFRDRNSRDAAGVAASPWNAPNGTGAIAGAPGTDACIEILFDFNNDGNFARIWNGSAWDQDFSDVRYFADGLATDPVSGNLNRMMGFMLVDTNWATITAGADTNFFNTTLATGKSYAAGDSAGDVIGASGNVARGWAPVGADGAVNAFDIDYVYAQFKTNPFVTDGSADWSDIHEAVSFDLSCDMDGDLDVDQDDVCRLVNVILGTTFGDVNLDGVVNATDTAIINANLNQAGGWAQGDMDGNGVVNSTDLQIANGQIDPCNPNVCQPDLTTGAIVGQPGYGIPNGILNNDDFFYYLQQFAAGNVAVADLTTGAIMGQPGYGVPNGVITNDDFFYYLAIFAAGC
ncbi:MAG: dockerin type I repeat-containing protein [Phycisphaerales bacterium]